MDGAPRGCITCPPGMASLDNKATGRMGMRAAVYYMVTTVIAVFIGILMVTIIHPGKGSKEGCTERVGSRPSPRQMPSWTWSGDVLSNVDGNSSPTCNNLYSWGDL